MATQPKPKPEPDPKPEPPEPDLGDAAKSPQPVSAKDLSWGQKAVGLTFNPSGDPTVHELKTLYAKIIDLCHMKRQSLMAGSEAHRLWSVAVTEAQGAQMWSVKAATWKD